MPSHIEVLVVSDSRMIREGLQSLVSTLTAVTAVYQADCDLDALRKLDKTAPSLMLIDCTMPTSECHALLAQARMQWPRIKFVVLVDSEEDRIRIASTFSELGLDTVLLKGIPAERLLATLKRLLPSSFPT